MKKIKQILTMSMVLSMLVPMVAFANGSKFLDIEALGKRSYIKLKNYVGKAPEMEGRKIVYFTKNTKWDSTSKDINLDHFNIIDDTAVTQGKTELDRIGSPGMSSGHALFRIIGRLEDGTLVAQTGDKALSLSRAKTLDEGEYVLSDFITDGKFIMAEKVGYLRVEGKNTAKPSVKKLVAAPTSSKVIVDHESVSFEAYTIDNSNYIKLRDFAYVVTGTNKQFEVSWDSEKRAINLLSNEPYTVNSSELTKGNGQSKSPVLNESKIYKDGKEIGLKAYTIDGNNYFKLRDLADAFGIAVTWDEATSTIGINTEQSL